MANLYWGGSERKITGLTLRVMGVNAVALLILLLGIIYLGEYHKSLIEARLQTFKAELELIGAAVTQGAVVPLETQDSALYSAVERFSIQPRAGQAMIKSLGDQLNPSLRGRLRLFDSDGSLIADSWQITGPEGSIQIAPLAPLPDRKVMQSIQILKNMTGFVIGLLPQRKPLPLYREPETLDAPAQDYPDARKALSGRLQISAWLDTDDSIYLSAATPIVRAGELHGVVLLTRSGRDIEEEIADVWLSVVIIFIVTLMITILLSIYLTGQIESPLRKLAKVAERVRLGQAGPDDIPDFSARHDEIGRLSLVLRDMTQALWNRLDMMERFAADVSHELKNPLTSLKSAVETASIVKKKADREKLNEIIKHDIHRMDRLITDIAHASRLDTELAREGFAPVDIRALMIALMDSYKDPLERQEQNESSYEFTTKYEGKTIRLNFISGEAVRVLGIGPRLLQVMQNLLSNALSFTPKDKRVSMNVIPVGGAVHLVIEDEGPGIPPAKLDNVFERFYSERPESENFGQHSGLGLSICKQIVDAHNGTIKAENIKNAKEQVIGARFTVILNTL